MNIIIFWRVLEFCKRISFFSSKLVRFRMNFREGLSTLPIPKLLSSNFWKTVWLIDGQEILNDDIWTSFGGIYKVTSSLFFQEINYLFVVLLGKRAKKFVFLFQNPGEIEEEMAQVGAKEVLKGILTTRRQGPPMLHKGQAFRARPGSPTPLPSWLSEVDLSYFASKYEQKGFTGPLNYYRSMDL